MPGPSRGERGARAERARGPGQAPGERPDPRDPRVAAVIESYWLRNLRVMAVLLAIWAFVGLGCGVLFADWLNGFRLGGFPLGFWFAQQGSILIFVLLILVYCLALNRLDAEHHRELERIRADTGTGAAGGGVGVPSPS